MLVKLYGSAPEGLSSATAPQICTGIRTAHRVEGKPDPAHVIDVAMWSAATFRCAWAIAA